MLNSKLLHQLTRGFNSFSRDKVNSFKNLLKIESIGVWEYDFKNQVITLCDISQHVFGIKSNVVTVSELLLVFSKSSTSILKDLLNGKNINVNQNFLSLSLCSGQEILLRAIPVLESSTKNIHFINGTVRIKNLFYDSIVINEINNSEKVVALFDADMRYLACSSEWLSVYNIQKERIKDESYLSVFSEEGETFINNFKECLSGVLMHQQTSFLDKYGSEKWLKQELKPWFIDSGKVGGVIIHTEAIFKTINKPHYPVVSKLGVGLDIDDTDSGIAIFNSKGSCISVNKKLSDILGYSQDEIKQLYFENITHQEDNFVVKEMMELLLQGSVKSCTGEKRYITKEGKIIHTMISISLKEIKGLPPHFVASITDITKKVEDNKRIKLAYAEMEAIFSASSKVIIMVTDVNGVIKQFNRGAENLLGYNKGEVISLENPTLFHCDLDLENKSKILSNTLNKEIEGFNVFTELAQSNNQTDEWIYKHKNGDCFPVQLTFDTIRDSEGLVIGYLGVGHDISKIKKHESKIQNLLEVSKAQNKRLLNFAHIVSHNLKSHSGNFSMLLDLLKEENKDIGDNEIVKMLSQASNNLSETISHLNEVVQLNTSSADNLISVNLNQALEKVIGNVLGIAVTSKVRIENQVDKNQEVLCIPAYLESILLNFLTNGIRYKSKNSKSFVKFTTLVDNNHVILAIEDNGLGIDLNRHQSKLFGMYKTFHDNKDSRGLGLFITKNQIEAIGGKVEVASEPDVGTVFRVYFKYEKN